MGPRTYTADGPLSPRAMGALRNRSWRSARRSCPQRREGRSGGARAGLVNARHA